MKVILYAKTGEEIQEVNCLSVTGMEGGFQRITLSQADAMGKALGTADTDPHFITNMTLHAEGVETGWGTPEPEGDTYQVSLHSADGVPIKVWKGCIRLSMLKGAVYFWNEGCWHVVNGDVVAEMEKK